jgi:hypothetical protein
MKIKFISSIVVLFLVNLFVKTDEVSIETDSGNHDNQEVFTISIIRVDQKNKRFFNFYRLLIQISPNLKSLVPTVNHMLS